MYCKPLRKIKFDLKLSPHFDISNLIILLIIQESPDRFIKSITINPNILPKTLFYRFNMSKFFLTFDLMEATRGQKQPSEVKNGMKESIY